MTKEDELRKEFDEISNIPEKKWSHNHFHYKYIVEHIDIQNPICLEIGCGKGELANQLTRKCRHIDAIDISSGMIKQAKYNFGDNHKINFICGDITTIQLEECSYDLIISKDAAHHIDFEWLCNLVNRVLKVNGQFILIDFYQLTTFLDYINSLTSTVADSICNIVYNGRISEYTKAEKEIWKKHEMNDNCAPFQNIKRISSQTLLSSTVYKSFFWRYILFWRKPDINDIIK